MRNPLSTSILIASIFSTAFGHWNYDRLIVNGVIVGESYQYIRKSNNSNAPLQNVNSTDMRCNSGGQTGSHTQTYTVKAGDELGFAIKDTFGHPGPQQVYLSKAPGSAAAYDGSGNWTKIYSLSYSQNSTYGSTDGILKWATHRARTFRFALPLATPPGEYLLRAEGLALHAAHKISKAQFYISCAQIKVTGNGTGEMGPTIRYPGDYRWNSTGILIPRFWSLITNYTTPGPKLWPAGTKDAHVLIGTVKTASD